MLRLLCLPAVGDIKQGSHTFGRSRDLSDSQYDILNLFLPIEEPKFKAPRCEYGICPAEQMIFLHPFSVVPNNKLGPVFFPLDLLFCITAEFLKFRIGQRDDRIFFDYHHRFPGVLKNSLVFLRKGRSHPFLSVRVSDRFSPSIAYLCSRKAHTFLLQY